MEKRKERERREGRGREGRKRMEGKRRKEQPNAQSTVCHYTLALGFTAHAVYSLVVSVTIFCERCSVAGMFFLSPLLFRLHSLLLPHRSSVILAAPHSVPNTDMEGFRSGYE